MSPGMEAQPIVTDDFANTLLALSDDLEEGEELELRLFPAREGPMKCSVAVYKVDEGSGKRAAMRQYVDEVAIKALRIGPGRYMGALIEEAMHEVRRAVRE